MSTNTEQVPAALLDRLAGELQPVRPFVPTRWMVTFVVLFAVASGTWLWRTVVWKAAYQTVERSWLLGSSAVELIAGCFLLGWVLREAIPGNSASVSAVAATGLTAGLTHVSLSLAAMRLSPMSVPEGQGWAFGIYCYRSEVLLGVPCLLFALWLSRRGLTSRPWRVGVIGGLGAGLVADSVWRLFCPYSEPAHSFGAHSGGIPTVVVGGLILAALWDALRQRAWRRRRSGG